MQTQAPISQYVSLCAQAGELHYQRAVIDAQLQQVTVAIDKFKAQDAIEKAALAKAEQQADEAGA